MAARPLAAQCYAEPQNGYPVVVKSADGSVEDADFLTAAATAFAYRWKVPTSARNEYDGWAKVLNRLIPPEPRWSDDWIPGDEHRAQIVMVLHRDGRLTSAAPKAASGDEAFDNSLKSIVEEPMPGGPKLPDFPRTVKGDSVVLAVFFGAEQRQPFGLVRFANVQTPPAIDRSAFATGGGGGPPPGGVPVGAGGRSGRVETGSSGTGGAGGRGGRGGGGGAPREGGRRAVIRFDLLATGEVRPESIEVLESANPQMATMIKNNLAGARFKPATQNCKDVALTILQIF